MVYLKWKLPIFCVFDSPNPDSAVANGMVGKEKKSRLATLAALRSIGVRQLINRIDGYGRQAAKQLLTPFSAAAREAASCSIGGSGIDVKKVGLRESPECSKYSQFNCNLYMLSQFWN